MATTIGNRVPDSGLSPIGKRHEVDLLLHEDSGDQTSTRVESAKKKGTVTDAINISELGSLEDQVLEFCFGARSESGM
jgi:hypothetical protein